MNPEATATILIADHEPASLGTLYERLRQSNYKVFMTRTATRTLQQVATLQPDIILLDVRLPDMDGFELCRRLKQIPSSSDTPIIFLSAFSDTADKIKMLNLTAVDVITRPLEADEVAACVDKHLTISTLRRSLEQKNAALQKEIAERVEAEQALRQRTRELVLINQAIESFTATLDLDQILQNVLGAVHNLLDITGTSLWLRQPDSGLLVCRHAAGPGSDKIMGWQLLPGQGLTGQAAETGDIIIVADTRTDPRHFKTVDRELGIETRSLLNLPLKTRAEVIGVLNLIDSSANRFSVDDSRLLEAIVAAAAAAIENARLYASVQESRLAAEAANRAKSAFLANISHELRTPLNGILGYTQILKHEPVITQNLENGLSIIEKSGHHLLTLINDILDLSKIEAGKFELSPEDIDLPDFLAGIVDIFRVRAQQKGLSFTSEAEIIPSTGIRVDGNRLRQVLFNLLGNAVKFTETGRVTLKATLKAKDDQPVYSQATPEAATAMLHISVEDTGPGISPSQVVKIFVPFEQVGDKQQRVVGAGLGLSISQRLVNLMGGNIEVISTEGHGSTFWFEIPVPAISIKRQAQAIGPRQIIGIKGDVPKILIVDDDWLSRVMMVNLLKPAGFRLFEATDGREGLIMAQEIKPDVIITDLFMPIMDGFDLTRQIRQTAALKDTLIITITAMAYDQDRQRSFAAGCNDFITKPIDASYLFSQLQHHLGLTWIYAENGLSAAADSLSTTLPKIPPPPEQMATLLELATHGDIGAIQERAVKLAQSDPQYQPFAAELLQLAESFQMQKLQNWLETYLPNQS